MIRRDEGDGLRLVAAGRLVFLVISLALALVPGTVTAQVLPAGPEFQVNTYTTSDQGFYTASIATDPAGNFVVVWESYGQDGYDSGVSARRYDSSGAPLGTEFLVNTFTISGQFNSSVSASSTGNFVVVWQSGGQDGDRGGIFGQRFASNGTPAGAEFQVNTLTIGRQVGPAVAADPSGNFLVVWRDRDAADGDGDGIFGQRFDSSGTPQGTEFQVNTITTSDQRAQKVAADGVGNFIVVWRSEVGDGDGRGIFGQRYDSAGAVLGTEFLVNMITAGNQGAPDVAADGAGNFVVVFNSGGVAGQRFDSTGALVGSEFQVTGGPSYGDSPAVSMDGAGGFVVSWESYYNDPDGDGYGVFAQRYNSAGAPEGGRFQVNSYTTGSQQYPDIAVAASGEFVVVWSSVGQDGDGYGVFAQRYGLASSIGGKKLIIKDNADPTKRKIVFLSKDAGVDATAVDPVADGAILHIYNTTTGDSACIKLPASAWQASGSTFKYKDKAFANGPCKVAIVKNGLLKAVCKATVKPITYTLDEAQQGSVSVNFRSGVTNYCVQFGGNSTIVKDSAADRQFKAKDATAVACPAPPVGCQ